MARPGSSDKNITWATMLLAAERIPDRLPPSSAEPDRERRRELDQGDRLLAGNQQLRLLALELLV
jgi:hypothetical protein